MTPQDQARSPEAPLGSLSFLLEEEREDRWRLRIGIAAALVFHVAAFVINWPTMASPPSEADTSNYKVFVVPQVKFQPPERRQIEIPERIKARVVPIPDPTPDDPEPFREVVNAATELEISPQYVGGEVAIPDPPPVETPPVLVNPPVPPQCIKRVEPQYSDAALHAHLEGSVVLQLTIDTEGKVVDVKVLKGLPLGLTDKAVEAAWRWTFKPSMLNGKAVSVIYNLSVIFRID